jgi:hypothetical protein
MPTMPRLIAAERGEAVLEAASVEIAKVVFSKTQTGARPESPAASSARRSRVSNANPEKRKAA